MKKKQIISKAKAFLAAAVIVSAVVSTSASAEILRIDSGSPSGTDTMVAQMLSKHAKQTYDIDLQVNSGQTLTKSALKLAMGQLELSVFPPIASHHMAQGTAMYNKLGPKAVKASGDLRSLFGILSGSIHAIVWEKSGIKTLSDLKNKKVFLGPPGGGAGKQIASIIHAATGFEVKTDYDPVYLGWGAGEQAFQDGAFDVYMKPSAAPNAAIEQLGLSKKFLLLGLEEKVLQSEGWKKHISVPGRLATIIPANTYQNQANNNKDITVGAYTMIVGINKKISDDVAYKLTTTYWANLKAEQQSIPLLQMVDSKGPFVALNVPLHPGAIKYYKEQGIEVPAHLIP